MTKAELADMLERFIGVAPSGGKWDWDDFTSVRAQPELEPFRERLLSEAAWPPGNEIEIRQIIAELRAHA